MNTNKKVTVKGEIYRMYQVASTGWVFVEGKKSTRTFSIAKIVDGEILEVESQGTFKGISNQELAEAWLTQ